jgi:hypothetical protein
MPGRVWVEAWSPEYGTSLDISGAGSPFVAGAAEEPAAEPVGEVLWAPVAPPGVGGPPARRPLAFLDGVSRVDARVLLERAGTPAAGLCGSVGVGAILADGAARFGPSEVHRAVVFEPGVFAPGQAVGFPPVSERLAYEQRPARGNRPEDIRSELEHLREEKEAALAAQLAGQGWVVIADGRLRWVEPMPIVGYIKSHHRHWLAPALEAVVPALGPGQRTPLFALPTRHLSWYLRLAELAGAHPWAGVVRCEVSVALGVDRALELADLTAGQLPRFASKGFWDSRSPQNLVPIATLERRLWHLLGDRELVLRRIRTAVARAFGGIRQ